ncbi:mitochondrial calcium uniporter regulator 1 isoform X1 [Coregonus clupeaformis]|uniref:mitochondrial calcium uniporter regulator 1 isoform X1 n=1 Tax=Coregonus clupeaformis TaxID=59861 RepID=UPI001BE03921|nr:mitochondrial calcium uniporter regulator 1 isoform X1 [Coregonus clupeaformis]
MSLQQRIAFHSRLNKFTLNSEYWHSRRENRICGDRASFTTVALQPNISCLKTTLTSSIHSRCKQCNTDYGSCNLDKRTWRRLFTGVSATLVFKRSFLFVRELSTSILQYELKTDMTKSGNRRLYFDTHALVRLLEENGFTTQQAEVIVRMMVRTTNSNMDLIYNDMVTKVQQEIMLQRVFSQIASVKKDMIILEKSEFSTLLADNEKVKVELLQLKVQLADVMNKVRFDNILDMNSEKSSVKEMKAEDEKRLMESWTEIMEMNAEQNRHLTQSNMKIDTEVAGLKTMLEAHKLDTIKYLAGSVFTCLTVVLGFYRIWM